MKTPFDHMRHARRMPKTSRSSVEQYGTNRDTEEAVFHGRLAKLLRDAHDAGLVITVDLQQVNEVPAMGNYRMIGHVRGAR